MQTRRGILTSFAPVCMVVFAAAAAQGQPAGPPGLGIGSLGNCCVDQIGPGCNEATCEALVCADDPLCCDSANGWDCLCADRASVVCPNLCTSGQDDCCISRDAPGCSNQACQDLVCTVDPFCCSGFWDTKCASGLVSGGGESCVSDPSLGAENLCGDLCHVEGDCARDFSIDLEDHGAFLLCVTGVNGGPVEGRCTCADLDADGDVDLDDWSFLQIILSE